MNMITKRRAKKHWLCMLGFHKFELKTTINGYIDTGSIILRHEESQIVCVRENCKKRKGARNVKMIEFEKKRGD